jgi:DNA polymerase
MVETDNPQLSPKETWDAKRTIELSYNTQILACERCSQRKLCTAPVPGEGVIHGKLLLVGDYPDNRTGKSFAPDAWDLLTSILAEIGAVDWASGDANNLDFINHGVYFTTAVKCGTKGKHKPRSKEMNACRPWLGAQVGIMRYETRGLVSVALGNLATAALTGKTLAACKVSFGHGIFEEIEGRLIMPTLHPNFVIRRGHAEWGYTRNQLRTDLDTAWRAAHRVFQPQTA